MSAGERERSRRTADDASPARRGRESEPAGIPVVASAGERERSGRAEHVIWHDVECAAYAADLPLWRELADEARGPLLELGCGTGRVSARLAADGHDVVAVDADPVLLAELERRADGSLRCALGDARAFALDQEFALAIAPMQLVQLLNGPDERSACLSCVRRHLRPGGRAAFAIVESLPETDGDGDPIPDLREVDGWVYSSLPVDVVADEEAIRVRRLRQVVAPGGEVSDELDEVRLERLAAGRLEREAREAGLRPAGRRRLPPTAEHVGSTVVLVEAP